MAEVNALVVFYSRHGETERLALAAGVGAVQARANIRLRRLKDLADASTIASDPIWTENLERMLLDYIAPREIDAEWADVILTASCPASPAEMEAYLKSLKPGATTVPIRDNPPDRIASARAQGRQAVENVKKQK
jgi:NAD(P)H dehydrogenase (quinone)